MDHETGSLRGDASSASNSQFTQTRRLWASSASIRRGFGGVLLDFFYLWSSGTSLHISLWSSPNLSRSLMLVYSIILCLLAPGDVSWARDCPNREFQALITTGEEELAYAFIWTVSLLVWWMFDVFPAVPSSSSAFSVWTGFVKSVTSPVWHYLRYVILNKPDLLKWCPGFRTLLEYGQH